MLFNSFDFAVFVFVAFGLYWAVRGHHRIQNLVILAASLLFYAWWDWRFVSLLVFSSAVAYFGAALIARDERPTARKAWLISALVIEFGVLALFKYFNFFAESATTLLADIGFTVHPVTLSVILPLGISFFTFEAVSYLVDVYRKEYTAHKRFDDFLIFMSFFPHLIAGPIMRAKEFLPQVTTPRAFKKSDMQEGTFLFLWGLYKKVFIADNLAPIVDAAFAGDQSGFMYLIALYAFGFQIYADFSGYSDMARGIAKWFGFDLSVNFNLPYFSKDPSDFWRRWHVTLSSWFRDYVYIPLGGNRAGLVRTCINLMLTMLLAGLWHGANWTFVLWGGYYGLLLSLHRIATALRPQVREGVLVNAAKIFLMLQASMIGWLLFRAESLSQVAHIAKSIISDLSVSVTDAKTLLFVLFYISPLVIIEWFQYRYRDTLVVWRAPAVIRIAVYLGLIYSIILFGMLGGNQFIYFQF